MPRITRRRKKEIVEALRAHDRTQVDLAAALGVTTSHVSHFLSGRRYTQRLDEGITAYLEQLTSGTPGAAA